MQRSGMACTGCTQRRLAADRGEDLSRSASSEARSAVMGCRLPRRLHHVHELGADGSSSRPHRRSCAPGARHPGPGAAARVVTKPRSDENDRVPTWVHSSSEQLERPPTVDRKAGTKRRGSGSEELSRSTGPRQHEDGAVDQAIADLEVQPTRQGLTVVRTGLGFDAVSPFGPDGDHGIPRPLLTRSGERYLGTPAKPGMKNRSKPLEEPGLRGVADRLRSGICPGGQLQPDYRGETCQLMDRR